MAVKVTTKRQDFARRFYWKTLTGWAAAALLFGVTCPLASNAAGVGPASGFVVNSTQALAAALVAARPNETILLAPGVYNPVIRNFYGSVTLTSQFASTPATIQSLKIYTSSGVRLTNLNFDLTGFPTNPAAGWSTVAYDISLSSNITLNNLSVHGPPNGTLVDRI